MLVKRIWIDPSDGRTPDPKEGDVDVMVELESGELWTAHFVTVPYLKQQLEMSRAVTSHHHGFMAMETPHVVVDSLDQEAITDVVYELMGSGTFESVFDLVMDSPIEEQQA